MPSLFDNESLPGSREPLQDGAVLLRGFALAEALALLEEVVQIVGGPPAPRQPVPAPADGASPARHRSHLSVRTCRFNLLSPQT